MTFSTRDYAVGLLTQKSERDKQVHIGASNISDPCTRCLGRDIAGDRRGTDTRAFLGGKVGTGVHSVMESAAEGDPNTVVERRISLGTIPGYGEVFTKPDAILLKERILIDWKTSNREKSKAMQQFLNMPVSSPIRAADKLLSGELKVRRYTGQGQLYAWALNRAGTPIETISIVFINRDGTGWFDHPDYEEYTNPNKNRDVWEFSVPYNEEYAVKLWDRAVRIFNALQEGKPLDTFPRHEACFRCDMIEAEDATALAASSTGEVSHA